MSTSLRVTFFAFLFLPAAGFLSVHAKDADQGSAMAPAKTGPSWLTPAQEDSLAGSIPDCPAAGSQTDKDDLAAVLKAQAARTPDQIKHVTEEEHFSAKLFQAVLGPKFSADQEPRTFGAVENAWKNGGSVVNKDKNKWQRPRPFVGHPDQVHAVLKADGFSYPSGHATAAYICALVLAEVFPAQKDALLQHAAQIAEDRVIGGVHYPSDIAAGEQLAHNVVAALMQNPDFQQALAAAKKEVAAK